MADDKYHDNTIAADLSLDIIMFQILPRISAKSVGRCKSVCKQWQSFLSTKEFTLIHLRHLAGTVANQKLLFIDKRSDSISTIDCESPNHGLTPINTVPFQGHRPSNVSILACLDGLVCSCLRETGELVIWNPLTHASKKLLHNRPYEVNWDAIGFYTDSSHDYKLLYLKLETNAYVYSLRLDSWKKIEFLEQRQQLLKWSSLIFCGDSVYFTALDCSDDATLLIKFDVNSEKFMEIRFPHVPSHVHSRHNLVAVEDHVYLFVCYDTEKDGLRKGKVDMWKLEGETWAKVMAYPGVQSLPSGWIPDYALSNGKWVVLWNWVMDDYGIDTETKEYMCLYPGRMFYQFERTLYIETTLSPNYIDV